MGKLVIVEWYDSYHESGWKQEAFKIDAQRAACTTVGWVVARDERFISIAQTIGEDGEYDCIMTIPIATVTKLRRIR